MTELSSKNRPDLWQQLGSKPFDLLVIGGGITGAGIALDAASRGLSVALIEMQDFASGTSGRSTKLIHGGLRYLKQLEFNLVAEVGTEREIIHRIAPHLTRPETMLMPITKKGSFSKFSTRLGMRLYEWLAGVKHEEQHRMLSVTEALTTEPLLRKEDLLGGALFYEYRTDDARLTLEVVREAVTRKALALNYVKAISFIYTNGRVSGVQAEDQLTGALQYIEASYVVNATGPWVDELDQLDSTAQTGKLSITKGVHLVVDHRKLPVKQSLYFDTYDKRMIFVIPREGKTYIGTTDVFYRGDKADPLITEEESTYLLACVNAYFPGSRITAADVESCWAGLRPLISKPGKGPSEISRKDETFVWDSGLITIAGGKLTGYRKMAQRVVDLVAEKIKAATGKTLSACSTQSIALANSHEDPARFPDFVKSQVQNGVALGLSEAEAELLVYRYGGNVPRLFSSIEKLKNTDYAGSLPLALYAQVLYAIEEELCETPADFFIRRTAALYFNVAQVRQYKDEVTGLMQEQLGWSPELRARFESELEAALGRTGITGARRK